MHDSLAYLVVYYGTGMPPFECLLNVRCGKVRFMLFPFSVALVFLEWWDENMSVGIKRSRPADRCADVETFPLLY